MIELGFSLGAVVLAGAIGLLAVLTLLFGVLWARDPEEHPRNNAAWPTMTGTFGILLVAVLIGAAFEAFPYDTKYWKDYRATGTVTQVSNVFENASGEVTEAYVVSLDSLDRPVTLSDPRAVRLLDKQVDLTCTISYEHRAQDRYLCRIANINN